MPMNDEAKMTEAGARLLNFLENHLRRQEYVEAEKLLRAILSEADDENGLPQPGGAMDQRHSFAMDSAHPGRVVADREMAIRQCTPYARGADLMACDSAENVFRETLNAMGVQTRGLHKSALPAMFDAAKRNVTYDGRGSPTPPIATDARASRSFAERFPGAARIRSV